MDWDGTKECTLDSFPGVTFHWDYRQLEAVTDKEVLQLYWGMPIWSVYFCDLTGDGYPEICSSISWGSGIVIDQVIIYDYAGGARYTFSDQSLFDYVLREQDDSLVVEKRVYNTDEIVASGEPVFLDGTIQIKTE